MPGALQVRVIRHDSDRLVGNADVAIYTEEGTLVARGHTDLYGESFYPELPATVDTSKKLTVRASYPLEAGSSTGEMTIYYDAQLKTWRPTTVYKWFKLNETTPGEWQEQLEEPQPAQLAVVRVMVRLNPVPHRRYLYAPSVCW